VKLPRKWVCIHSYQWVKVSLSFTSLSLIVFRSPSFTHWFSFSRKFFQLFLLTYFWFFSQHFIPRSNYLFQNFNRNSLSSIFIISTTCTQPLYWRYRTLFIFYFIFFHSNRSVQKCDLFLFKILNIKLQKHFINITELC
jgi:hypothetical protein